MIWKSCHAYQIIDLSKISWNWWWSYLLSALSKSKLFSLIFGQQLSFLFPQFVTTFSQIFFNISRNQTTRKPKEFLKTSIFSAKLHFCYDFFAEKLRSSSSTPTTKLLSSARLLKSWEKINKQKRKHADDTQKPKGEVRRTWHFVVLS